MGHRPAEVHLDVDDLLIPNREDLGVPESTAVRVASFVGHEHAVGICDEMDEVEPVDDLAVRPATSSDDSVMQDYRQWQSRQLMRKIDGKR